jgi:hypothetical protein
MISWLRWKWYAGILTRAGLWRKFSALFCKMEKDNCLRELDTFDMVELAFRSTVETRNQVARKLLYVDDV